MEALNIPSDQIQMKAQMKIPRKGHSSAYLNGKIFVIGGLTNRGEILDSIEFYNFSTD